ncbi:MAG: hypothetical protein KDB71_07935 [Mycobacterium sp.]|nr:hypothetical protein [Mycobacterium sp.]
MMIWTSFCGVFRHGPQQAHILEGSGDEFVGRRGRRFLMTWLRVCLLAAAAAFAAAVGSGIGVADPGPDIDVPPPPSMPQVDIPGIYDPGAINPNISVSVPQVGCDDPLVAAASVGC